MREEFEKLVAAGKLGRQHVDPLVTLAQGGYCTHRSWGFGRITTVDTVFGRFTIDFQTKAGHSMDLTFAAESLKPISGDHILARKLSDLNGLRQLAGRSHLELIKVVLRSFGGRATLDQVQQILVPDVIADDWKKWWEVAKRELKKDGHFLVPTKKTEPIVYQEEQVSLQDRVMKEFRAAKGLKARLVFANELLRSAEDLADRTAAVNEAIAALNGEIVTHQKTQPALALEAVFVRDDLRAVAAAPAAADSEITAALIWDQSPRIGPLLEAMPATKHKQTLQSFREAHPADWSERLLMVINHVPARICGEVASLLVAGGRLNNLKDALARTISQHTASSEALIWLGKERSDTYADVLGPEVFRAMITAIERDQFNEKKSNRLRDFIMGDQELIVDLIESADIEVVKDLVRALRFSPSFDDMDKRSLLGRIVKIFPSIQSLISGDSSKQEASLFVSWASLERRRKEYADLVQKQIPANSKDIAIARSYGDLRENHEYKAAKEAQKVLMRRKHELESQLSRARGTDFANPRTDVVGLGTRVRVTDIQTSHTETFEIRGAWDFDEQSGVISYLSPVGQALLNHKAGDELEFEHEGALKHFRIDGIEAAPPLPAPASSPADEPQPATSA